LREVSCFRASSWLGFSERVIGVRRERERERESFRRIQIRRAAHRDGRAVCLSRWLLIAGLWSPLASQAEPANPTIRPPLW